MSGDPKRPRLLLVEFTAVDRGSLQVVFPFVYGMMREIATVETRWLRFSLDAAVRSISGRRGLDLGPAELDTLAQVAATLKPTHVVFSSLPSGSLWATVHQQLPAALGAVFDANQQPLSSGEITAPTADSAAPVGGDSLTELRDHAALIEWMGLTSSPELEAVRTGLLFDLVRPDFGFEPGNVGAAKREPLGFIMAGAECLYVRAVASNPLYEGVDLEGCQPRGCAFCVGGSEARAWSGSTVDRALRQIDAFLETYPFTSPRSRASIRLPGDQLLNHIQALAEALGSRQGRALNVQLSARTDRLLKMEAALMEAAQILESSPHRLSVCLVGAENFVELELARMNKGLHAWQNLAAIRALRRVERAHGRSFALDAERLGNLSTIIFTPWTRLEDLALNLAVVSHFGLERLCHKFFTSRLRLYAHLPMTALARRDGLIVESYEDPALDTAKHHFYPDEIPWRFADSRMNTVNRLLTRLEPSQAMQTDPLAERVQRWAGAATSDKYLRFQKATTLVKAALNARGEQTVEALLEAADVPEPEPVPTSALPVTLSVATIEAQRMLAQQRAGLRAVGRIEMLIHTDAEALGALVQGEGRSAVVVAREKNDRAATYFDLFFGAEPREVEEAIDCTRRLKDDAEGDDQTRAITRTGALYGYPPCCTERFAANRFTYATNYEWTLLRMRSEHAGPIDSLFNPFASTFIHVPCSFTCEATLALAEQLAKVSGQAFTESQKARCEHPFLFLLDRPGQFIELVPRSTPGRCFDFEAGAVVADDPRLLALQQGGRITIEEGMISVERDGQRIEAFFLSAAVFWTARAFDPDFWRQCALEALDPLAPALPVRSGRDRAPASSTEQSGPAPGADQDRPAARTVALADDLRGRLVDPEGRGRAFGPGTVQAVEPSAGRKISVTLVGPEAAAQTFVVFVEPLESASHYFRVAGKYAVSYSNETPMQRGWRRRAMRGILDFLAD